jgi:hypothetical protein
MPAISDKQPLTFNNAFLKHGMKARSYGKQ